MRKTAEEDVWYCRTCGTDLQVRLSIFHQKMVMEEDSTMREDKGRIRRKIPGEITVLFLAVCVLVTGKTIAAQSEDWKLILVNQSNLVPEEYEVTLAPLGSGHFLDERCYQEFQTMMEDCRAQGLYPLVCSSYRSHQRQKELYNDEVTEFLIEGHLTDESRELAGTSVAVPGTSEHELGLALDIVDVNYQVLDEEQENTPVQIWLKENSWKYGFILRYPNDKSEITGIVYEPWHYRYVGKEAAAEIHEQGICLEEYLE